MPESQEITGKFRALCELCKSPAEVIKTKKNLLVVSHVDADGLTAAAIVCTALVRRGLDFQPKFFRQLDETALSEVADYGADLVIFTDLGSGMAAQICDHRLPAIIADHHKPALGEARPMAHINP
ncbi:MAG: recombinase RecJ, partial [Methanothrix sp.]|nr:recombinase RecJ [Methanothrix sp.]